MITTSFMYILRTPIIAEITVGFNPVDYTVNEADGEVLLNVEVLSGTLERSVEIFFGTSPGTATEQCMQNL